MNDGYDYLNEIVQIGFLKLWFDSETQEFSVVKKECKDLTDNQITSIMNGLEVKLEQIRIQNDKTSGFTDVNETPPEIKSQLSSVEGYIRFRLCILHKLIEPDEVYGEMVDIWPNYVQQQLSQELVDWLV